MNSRFLLLALYVLVVTLVIQFFLPKNTNNNPLTKTDIILQIQKESLTIPNIPQIEVVNNLTGEVIVHPCQDITLSVDSKPFSFSGIEMESPLFCQTLAIKSGSKALLPFSEIPKLFASVSGKYIVTLKTSL